MIIFQVTDIPCLSFSIWFKFVHLLKTDKIFIFCQCHTKLDSISIISTFTDLHPNHLNLPNHQADWFQSQPFSELQFLSFLQYHTNINVRIRIHICKVRLTYCPEALTKYQNARWNRCDLKRLKSVSVSGK